MPSSHFLRAWQDLLARSGRVSERSFLISHESADLGFAFLGILLKRRVLIER